MFYIRVGTEVMFQIETNVSFILFLKFLEMSLYSSSLSSFFFLSFFFFLIIKMHFVIHSLFLCVSQFAVYTGDYNMTPDRHLGAAWINRVEVRIWGLS